MRLALPAALAFLALAPAARAAVITENLTVTANGLSDLSGGGSVAPVDPVSLSFSITFDTAAVVFGQSSGIALLASNVTTGGPLSFDYDGAGLLTVGIAGSIGISEGTPGLLLTLTTLDGTPQFAELDYTTTGAGIFDSVTGTVSVPEPASVALLASFVGLAGLRRGRRG